MWATGDGEAEFYALTTPMLACIPRGSRFNVLSATLTLVGSFLGAEEDTVIGPVLATLERAVGQCVILANAPPATVSGPNSTQPTTTATPLRVLQQCTPKREREPSPRPPSSDVQAPGLQGVRFIAAPDAVAQHSVVNRGDLSVEACVAEVARVAEVTRVAEVARVRLDRIALLTAQLEEVTRDV